LLALRSVYTIDLLGEPGMSVQDRPITDDLDQAAWLHDVLALLPEQRIHVAGLSIGGWTAMNLAVHRPEKIASLTLIEPVFVFARMSVEAIVRSIPASVPWLPKKMRDDFNGWTAGGAPVEDEPVARMIEAGMTYRLKLPIPGVIDEARIAALDIPTLVIFAR
jgi:pimeloyl-ACP methyl ester carboxylesterase